MKRIEKAENKREKRAQRKQNKTPAPEVTRSGFRSTIIGTTATRLAPQNNFD